MRKLVVLVFLLSACSSQKDKAEQYLKQNPEDLAKWCNFYFPSKTDYVQGETIVKTDTIYMQGDSIPCEEVKNNVRIVKQFVKCPPKQIVTNTITRVDTIRVEDTAKTYVYQSQKMRDDHEIDLLKKEIADLKEKRKKTAGFLAAATIILLILIYTRKKWKSILL